MGDSLEDQFAEMESDLERLRAEYDALVQGHEEALEALRHSVVVRERLSAQVAVYSEKLADRDRQIGELHDALLATSGIVEQAARVDAEAEALRDRVAELQAAAEARETAHRQEMATLAASVRTAPDGAFGVAYEDGT